MFDTDNTQSPFSSLDTYVRELVRTEVESLTKSTKHQVSTVKELSGDISPDHKEWPDGCIITAEQIIKALNIGGKKPLQNIYNWQKLKGLQAKGGAGMNMRFLTDDIKSVLNNRYSRKTTVRQPKLKVGRATL